MTSSHLSLLTPLHEATILEYDSRFDREIPQKKKNFHQGLELYLNFYIFLWRAIRYISCNEAAQSSQNCQFHFQAQFESLPYYAVKLNII